MTELMSNWRRWVEAGPENVLFSFIIARGTGKQTTNARLVYLTEGFVSDRSFFCSGTTLRTRQETVKPGAREKKNKTKKTKNKRCRIPRHDVNRSVFLPGTEKCRPKLGKTREKRNAENPPGRGRGNPKVKTPKPKKNTTKKQKSGPAYLLSCATLSVRRI